MSQTLDDLNRIIERLERCEKTADDYIALTRLKWKREKMIAERTVRQLDLAPRLVDAYHRTGAMAIDCRGTRITVTEFSGLSAMERAHSVVHDAKYLAWLATEPLPPLTLASFPADPPSR